MFLLKHFNSLKNNAELFIFFFSTIMNFNILLKKFLFFEYFYLFLNVFLKFVKLKIKKKNYLTSILKNFKYCLLNEYKFKYSYLSYLINCYKFVCIVKIVFKSHNIFINVTNVNGKTLKFYSSGFLGFKGREKSTLLAGKDLAKSVSKFIEKYFTTVEVCFIGKKGYTKSIIEGLLFNKNLIISKITIKDKASHGGCRLKKKSRK